MSSDPVIRANQATNAYPKLGFTSFDAPEPTPVVEEQLAASDPEIPPETEQEPEPEITLPTAEEIEQIHQQAFKDGHDSGHKEGIEAGHKEGYDTGYEEGCARGRLEAAELHQLVDSLDTALSSLDKTIGEEILSLSLEIARLVVRDTISTKPEIIATVVREALQQSPHPHAQIHLHPADIELVKRYLVEQITQSGHRLIDDGSIERGGCKIEAAGTHVDASVATRWQRVTESLSQKPLAWADDKT